MLIRVSETKALLKPALSLVVISLGLNSTISAAGPLLEQISPTPTTYVQGVDFGVFNSQFGSVPGIGNVTAQLSLIPVDATPGCEPGDFAGFTAGRIALISRGFCFFSDKINNAAAAGAVGALIYNSVDGVFNGGLVASTSIPALTLDDDLGASLIAQLRSGPVVIHMEVTEQTSVPAPSTLALLVIGGLTLRVLRRKRAVAL